MTRVSVLSRTTQCGKNSAARYFIMEGHAKLFSLCCSSGFDKTMIDGFWATISLRGKEGSAGKNRKGSFRTSASIAMHPPVLSTGHQ